MTVGEIVPRPATAPSSKTSRRRGTSTPDERAQWQAERETRTTALLEQLQAGIAAIQTSEQFRQYLRTAARFHAYSLNNVLLIMWQRPNATHVAGYRTWQQLGRQVKKGERAIYIFAPRPYHVTMTTDTDEEDTRTGCTFRPVPVFDISQTDGAPLPTLQTPTLSGEAGQEAYDALHTLAIAEGLTVTTHDPDTDGDDRRSSYEGYYSARRKLIFVKQATPTAMCATLIHELAHYLDPGAHTSPPETSETVAEAAAFVVAEAVGIDTSGYSFPYIAGWTARQDGAALVKQLMARIHPIAQRLLAALEPATAGIPPETESNSHAA